MTFQLSNNSLKITVDPLGAELTSIRRLYGDKPEREYLWQADDAYWGRHAPVLFPIVGRLKNNTYLLEGLQYHLPQHGFARDNAFRLVKETEEELVFSFTETENTLKLYPFQFELRIGYKLVDYKIEVSYNVKNNSAILMPFCIGGHPGFDLGKEEGLLPQDFYLYFEKEGENHVHELKAGLLTRTAGRLLPFEGELLPITPQLFENDALVYTKLESRWVALKHKHADYEVKLELGNFPHLGIWGKADLPFLCLEPWQGFADFDNHNQELSSKAGAITLASNEAWSGTYSLSFG